MSDTPNIKLPYMLAAQSQKHVTHNEALRMLDAVVQLSVLDRHMTAPPGSPVDGDRYIVAASPTGAWAGQAEKVAAYQDAAWMFYAPKEGWFAWIADENAVAVFDGVGWALTSGGGGGTSDHGLLIGLGDDDHAQYLNNARGDARYTRLAPTTLGVNATADTTNRLAVGSAASLFNHAGTGGHQIKVNKATAADTAGFLFQTGFSGRAELGTTGDDDFHFKVSPNGSTWKEALLIDRTSGAVAFPNSPVITMQTFAASGTWTKPTGCRFAKITVIGGGGGGGGAEGGASQAGAGGGAGAGGVAIRHLDVTAIATVAVTVGAGGAGGAGNAAGTSGATSSFGIYASATGGAGGSAGPSGTALNAYNGGAGGNGSGGDVNGAGGPGAFSMRFTSSLCNAGTGGSSYFSGGARGTGADGNGADAAVCGAGGAGAAAKTAANRTGGSGAAGVVMVEEYY